MLEFCSLVVLPAWKVYKLALVTLQLELMNCSINYTWPTVFPTFANARKKIKLNICVLRCGAQRGLIRRNGELSLKIWQLKNNLFLFHQIWRNTSGFSCTLPRGLLFCTFYWGDQLYICFLFHYNHSKQHCVNKLKLGWIGLESKFKIAFDFKLAVKVEYRRWHSKVIAFTQRFESRDEQTLNNHTCTESALSTAPARRFPTHT